MVYLVIGMNITGDLSNTYALDTTRDDDKIFLS